MCFLEVLSQEQHFSNFISLLTLPLESTLLLYLLICKNGLRTSTLCYFLVFSINAIGKGQNIIFCSAKHSWDQYFVSRRSLQSSISIWNIFREINHTLPWINVIEYNFQRAKLRTCSLQTAEHACVHNIHIWIYLWCNVLITIKYLLKNMSTLCLHFEVLRFFLVFLFLCHIITHCPTENENIQHQRFCCSCRFAKTIGMSVPMKATFFITYIMVDGWAGIAAEILRLVPLVIFHLKNTFLVKTEQDREQAMDPGFLSFATSEPRIQLYILLGLVYSVITPVLLPFIIAFFAFSFLIFRHQVHQDIGLAIIFKCFNTCINASDKS